MGHYDDQYEEDYRLERERRERIEKAKIAKGYEKVPEPLRDFLKQEWIHADQLKTLRRWLNTCPYCKLVDD